MDVLGAVNLTLLLGGPFLIVVLLPGLRTWFVAAVIYAVFLWAGWPRCQTAADVDCNVGMAMFTLMATPFGAAVLARGFQIAFLPWQQWWVRIALGLVTLAVAASAYHFIWYR
jgi:cation transport ATPase